SIGYDGVELFIGMGQIDAYRQLGKVLRDLELQTSCVCVPDVERNPASPDASVRAAATDWLKGRLDCANAIAADVLVGPNHSAFAHFSRQAPSEDEYRWSAEVMHSVGDHAADAGVVIALEALNRFECYLCNTAEQLVHLVDLADHSQIRAMFDTHHANIEEKSSASAIATLGDRLAHVHISENDRGTPGSGSVAWDEVFSALARANYDGWMTIESFSRRDVDFANAINVWREFSPVEEVTEAGFEFIQSNINKYFAKA
ncbi:MAG: sugar phosphate isomerase/epimerase family protein, partial [Planctomycetota bacterium]